MKQYVLTDLEADRQVATTLAELIIGGSLASIEIGTGQADHEVTPEAPWTGSGWREHSCGGFGGEHPPFHLRQSPLRGVTGHP
jgi:hypothetical protein